MLEVQQKEEEKRLKPRFYNCYREQDVVPNSRLCAENRPRHLVYDDDQDTDEELIE